MTMAKKLLIVGLVFLVAGAALLGSLQRNHYQRERRRRYFKVKYATEAEQYLTAYQQWLAMPAKDRNNLPGEWWQRDKGKSQEQVHREQQERLQADMEKLSSIEPVMYLLADFLYGQNWQQEAASYAQQQRKRNEWLAISLIATSFGGGLIICSILVWSIHRLATVKQKSVHQKEVTEQEQADTQEELTEPVVQEDDDFSQPKIPAELLDSTDLRPEELPEISGLSELRTERLYTNAESIDPFEAQQQASLNLMEMLQRRRKKAETERASTQPLAATEDIKEKTKQVAKQIEELEHERTQLKTIPNSNATVIDETLKRLTDEVSAIRQYASHQQDRVKRLQEGYDWNIIRNFCLRVIRCLDNLERRIDNALGDSNVAEQLEEVRDDMLFALESSGIEHFQPQLHSEYRGQEKAVEAVKDREPATESSDKGKIAKVIRCGYRYVVDEDDYKIIRAAQVKLFG